MTEEEKRLQQEESGAAGNQMPQAPAVYGGAYDAEINKLYEDYANRGDFNYNVNGDALFQQYKDRYTENAKRGMRDTMGQAASLTGGYGSTYSQGVGQQAYAEQMRGLTDKIPELEERAFERYQQKGQDILNRYNLASQLGAADQATRQYADQQTQLAYTNLTDAILRSGYTPNTDELAAAGMTQEQAAALRQAWIGSNPELAYYAGAITAKQYRKLTGKNPPGYVAPAAYYGGKKKKKKKKSTDGNNNQSGNGNTGTTDTWRGFPVNTPSNELQ